jgi:hypothetical protein
MRISDYPSLQKAGELSGILFSFLLSTTVLFFILSLTKKLPPTWSILTIAGIILGVFAFGVFLQRILR